MSQPSPYMFRDTHLVLDNPGKQYVYKIRDLAPADKPRERLLSAGPGALTLPQLLSVVLNVGTVREGVLEMSSRIMQEYGEKSLAARNDAKRLSEDLDIPLIKATQIVACIEIGRRLFERNRHGQRVVRTARDVFEYAANLRLLPKEHLRGIYLNAHYKVIHDEVVSIGTVDANMIHPREVFKPALEYSAAAVILVHNHPSGETAPSEADKIVTAQLVAAGKLLGVHLIDHVVVTESGFESVPADYE